MMGKIYVFHFSNFVRVSHVAGRLQGGHYEYHQGSYQEQSSADLFDHDIRDFVDWLRCGNRSWRFCECKCLADFVNGIRCHQSRTALALTAQNRGHPADLWRTKYEIENTCRKRG